MKVVLRQDKKSSFGKLGKIEKYRFFPKEFPYGGLHP